MEEANMYCDQPGCSQGATAFGFLPGGMKTKVCEGHLSALTRKQLATFSIAAYHFIQSMQDVSLYEERKDVMQKGLGTVSIMQSRCEEEWVRGQAWLQETSAAVFEVMQKAYEQVWRQGKQGYDQTLQQLQDTRSRLERLVLSKDFQLSSEDLALCTAVPSGSPFRLVVGDCRVKVAETVLTHFHLLSADSLGTELDTLVRQQADQGQVDVAYEVSRYASEHGYPVTDFQEAALRLMKQNTQKLTYLLPHGASQQEIAETVEMSVMSGSLLVQTGNYGLAVEEYEKGRTLLRMRDLQDSEEWLQLSNSLAETFHQEDKYTQCVNMCERVLQTWGRHHHTFQLWRAVFLLAEFLYRMRLRTQANALVEEWTGKLEAASPGCQCMSLCTQAIVLLTQGRYEEAVTKFETGLESGQLPQTYFTAYCRLKLGFAYECLKKPREAEAQYLQSCTQMTVVCPFAVSACHCLNRLGDFYRETHRPASAEEKLLKAYSVLSTHYPESETFGFCLFWLGLLFRATNRREEAVQKLKTALPLLKKFNRSAALQCEETLQDLRR